MKLNTLERGEHGKPVIFLHGLFGRGRNLGFLQRAATEHFRTFAFDLRAHGDSAHAPISYPAMVQDVLETMDALNIGQADIVGHSMGGKVAMLTALIAPERVSKLMVADIAPVKTHQGHNKMIPRLRAIAFPATLNRAQALDLLMPHVEGKGVAELLLQNLKLGENPGWAIGIEQISEAIEKLEGWPDIHVEPWYGPTLFLRGENSTYVQPQHHELIRTLFPNARIETLEGAGHWLHAEQPRAFTDQMMAFLQS
ncbi:alpha/beta fold hydrolase [Gluconobacter wancherniae]|uniref:alpha/beta fold hydrolase n=1 Tax=Gluconobacter wancherniae TaxID=1307955 RepID=UPI001B8D1D52|nr:alpha/beta fold hydrolase [Gluconobacter wancherniae]MBS1063769.1 alpha/beta fold hydrolase [Gluconobacter wancherniae]